LRDYETPLYAEIAESIRHLIVSGELTPGEQLPTIRDQAGRWGCTAGTVSRAYAMLAEEGLVVGHRGAGTRVTPSALQAEPEAWRWADLVNLAERFLLEALHSGHAPAQVEAALSMAIARWQELQSTGTPQPRRIAPQNELCFVGSHDLVVEMLPRMLAEHAPAASLQLEYVGSLGGLMALARNEADLAGIHLWDATSDSYNAPFVRRVLPGRSVVLLTLFHRSLGLIVQPGNPLGLQDLDDLTKPGVRFVNRQPGSGTRVWLEAQLKARGLGTDAIPDYDRVKLTHLAVAQAVAEEEATVGLGIQAAAAAYGLGFVPLTEERYDLALPEEVWVTGPAQQLVKVIRSPAFEEAVKALGGYDLSATGQESWIQ
jgi:molybdate-binding protein/DNA-binding transcriptional regulator YhcF (GntR family)